MDSLNLRVIFDRKKIADNSNKKGSVEIYVYDKQSQKKVYLSTGVEVLKNEYSDKSNKIVKHQNALSLNGKINKMFRDIEAFTLSDKCVTIQDVKNWNSQDSCGLSILSFIESELRRRNPSIAVITHNKALTNQIESFRKFKSFKDLTYNNIIEFDTHLKENGISTATAYKRHSMFHGYIREAINRGYCSYDPYMTFRPEKGKSKDPIFLELEELELLRDYDLTKETESNSLEKVKDLFIFQCYTGLAYVDLMALKASDISEVEGYKVIRSNRIKTDQGFISVLLPDAISILEKYNYILPNISNQKYNAYLKLVSLYVKDSEGKQAIKKKLTTHVARHTFGTYLVNKGVPYETVARAMGHSNTKMTKHYAKLLGKTVVNDIVNFVLKV